MSHRSSSPIRTAVALAVLETLLACGGPTGPPGDPSDPPDLAPVDHVILEGTVRRFTTDQLLAGVDVRADEHSVTSSGKGAYAFTDLVEGEVEIRATLPGFLPYFAKQRLKIGRNRHDIDLVPERQR